MYKSLKYLALFGGEPIRATALPGHVLEYGERELLAARKIILSREVGWPDTSHVDALEGEFSALMNRGHAVAVDHCTSALHCAMEACGVGLGDEVLVPDFAYVSTLQAPLYQNATPILVDIDPDTFNLSVVDARKKITSRTKAIMVVHMYGRIANMDEIVTLARQFQLKVIEDVAQALGATRRGRQAGTWGDFSCFSFSAKKVLSCGEGGIVLCKRRRHAEMLREFRNNCRCEKPVLPAVFKWKQFWGIGHNYLMSEFAAAILREQLKRLGRLVSGRQRVAFDIHQRLEDAAIPGITLQSFAKGERPAFWRYVFCIDPQTFGITGCQFSSILRGEGIPAYCYMGIPLHKQPFWVSRRGRGGKHFPFREHSPNRQQSPATGRAQICPTAARVARREVTIEINHTWSREDVKNVVAAVKKVATCLESTVKSGHVILDHQIPK